MYTKGITKIFRLNAYYGHLDVIAAKALELKEKAFLHNGYVYIFDSKNQPVQTPFTIEDFEVNYPSAPLQNRI